MDVHFLCLTPGTSEINHSLALLCGSGGCASNFYLAQRYFGRVRYCSRSVRP